VANSTENDDIQLGEPSRQKRMTILEMFTVQIRPRLYRIAGEWTDNAEKWLRGRSRF
jgi:hypothetical protein